MFDYLIVGSGLFGCVFAQQAKKNKKSCLILEKRNHAFGNCYTETIKNIDVHKYGPHIFHTANKYLWDYVNLFASFNNFINRPKVNYNNKIFSFPINLLTLYQLWGVSSPEEAKNKLEKVKINISNPHNFEDWILSQVGEEIYYTFIYGYTKKQWGIEPKELPSFIIKRLPIRLDFNDNYFDHQYQGIPMEGYSSMMQNMVDGIEIILETDYLNNRDYWDNQAKNIIYTGSVDEFYNYEFGKLQYRSIYFEHEHLDLLDYQGNAIINFTSEHTPYTRIIEHKHFNNKLSNITIISKEYSQSWSESYDRFYPINTEKNNKLYSKYRDLTKLNHKFIFGGRLGEFKYYNMDQTIASALHKYEKYSSKASNRLPYI